MLSVDGQHRLKRSMTHQPYSRQFAFVLMPLRDDFTDVYESGIKLACEEAGVHCEHVRHQKFDETILA